MKKFKTTYLFSYIIIFSLISYSQTNKFEGKLKFNVTDKSGTQEIEMFVKGDKAKIVVPEHSEAKVIYDSKEKKIITIIDEAQMYMETPLKMELKSTDKSSSDQNLKKTGNKKKILGYECEEIHYKTNKEEIEMWVSKENIPFFGFDAGSQMQQQKSSFPDLQSLNFGFPFLVIAKSNNQVHRFEVTSIEKKSLDSSMFEIPSGYQKMDMNMMRQMK